jgi:hypothetical protein
MLLCLSSCASMPDRLSLLSSPVTTCLTASHLVVILPLSSCPFSFPLLLLLELGLASQHPMSQLAIGPPNPFIATSLCALPHPPPSRTAPLRQPFLSAFALTCSVVEVEVLRKVDTSMGGFDSDTDTIRTYCLFCPTMKVRASRLSPTHLLFLSSKLWASIWHGLYGSSV